MKSLSKKTGHWRIRGYRDFRVPQTFSNVQFASEFYENLEFLGALEVVHQCPIFRISYESQISGYPRISEFHQNLEFLGSPQNLSVVPLFQNFIEILTVWVTRSFLVATLWSERILKLVHSGTDWTRSIQWSLWLRQQAKFMDLGFFLPMGLRVFPSKV